jgi:RNA polymerase sigma-70 factor (ECF subfamily)
MPPETIGSIDEATAIYSRHRDHLFSVAYSMLGMVADTEDVLQETWMAWTSAKRAEVLNPHAYLTRITINTALAKLKQARHDRVRYTGPWLPEPLVSEADGTDRAIHIESVSLALMVVLESLSPLERAVFVLDEAFGYRHAEISEVIGRSPAAVRQLARRARAHVEERRPRYSADSSAQRTVTQRFLAAAAGGDVSELLAALAPDVTLCSDGGGKRRAALNVLVGRDNVARFLAAVLDEWLAATWRPVMINGELGVLVTNDDGPIAVSVLDIGSDGLVHGVNSVMNPDKLAHIGSEHL